MSLNRGIATITDNTMRSGYGRPTFFNQSCGSHRYSHGTVCDQVLPPMVPPRGTHLTRVKHQVTRWRLCIILDLLMWPLLGAAIHAKHRNTEKYFCLEIPLQLPPRPSLYCPPPPSRGTRGVVPKGEGVSRLLAGFMHVVYNLVLAFPNFSGTAQNSGVPEPCDLPLCTSAKQECSSRSLQTQFTRTQD